MKRTAATLMLLAVLGGCRSTHHRCTPDCSCGSVCSLCTPATPGGKIQVEKGPAAVPSAASAPDAAGCPAGGCPPEAVWGPPSSPYCQTGAPERKEAARESGSANMMTPPWIQTPENGTGDKAPSVVRQSLKEPVPAFPAPVAGKSPGPNLFRKDAPASEPHRAILGSPTYLPDADKPAGPPEGTPGYRATLGTPVELPD